MAYSEVYVLCQERSADAAVRFLDKFLPVRRGVAEEYYYPENSDKPTFHTTDEAQLIAHLVQIPKSKYGIYWDQEAVSEPSLAMLFFTEDGGMIAGLAVPEEASKRYLGELAQDVRGRFGMVSFEERPPDTTEEFIYRCRSSGNLRIVDGMLVE